MGCEHKPRSDKLCHLCDDKRIDGYQCEFGTGKSACWNELNSKVFDLSPGMWWFGAKAVAGGAESKLSNVVAVEVPKPPAQMRTIAVQYSYTLTNFYDLGFFKLRIESP